MNLANNRISWQLKKLIPPLQQRALTCYLLVLPKTLLASTSYRPSVPFALLFRL